MQLIDIVQHVTKAILTIACVHNVKDFYTSSIPTIWFCSYGYLCPINLIFCTSDISNRTYKINDHFVSIPHMEIQIQENIGPIALVCHLHCSVRVQWVWKLGGMMSLRDGMHHRFKHKTQDTICCI